MAAFLPRPPPLPLFPTAAAAATSSSSSVRRRCLVPNNSRGNGTSIQTSSPPNQQQQQKPSPPTDLSSSTSKVKKSYSNHSTKSANKHPAFRPLKEKGLRSHKVPLSSSSPLPEGISVGNNGVSYRLEGAPFEFQYSYTETPKAKPVALREPPYLPFGPGTMPRPWTGKAPLPKSRKKIPEFDSFKPPPPGKRGVKSVQPPGPFLPGTGPRYVASRDEILGDPLTQEEVKSLLKSCLRDKRQLNIGRDGLTHNMLDNIHAHWKRRRVCKIKCKGVCTVDMDNVLQQLEDKTGGKVIYSRGGVMFLFRGRNYNHKTRPRFPLMLWKPASPVYPKLVRRVPEGLTLEEAIAMRKKGRTLPPICKLGKNGVYSNLVQNVKEAFEVCELARVNCTGLNKSDVRKIGAKLKDLVPCVLISFEFEHILMWRGKDWKSSLVLPADHVNKPKLATSIPSPPQLAEASGAIQQVSVELEQMLEIDSCEDESCTKNKDGGFNSAVEESDVEADDCSRKAPYVSDHGKGDAIIDGEDKPQNGTEDDKLLDDASNPLTRGYSAMERNECLEISGDLPVSGKKSPASESSNTEISSRSDYIAAISTSKLEQSSGDSESTTSSDCMQIENRRSRCMDGIATLLKQATENGFAVSLDGCLLNDDIIYERAVDLARTAPQGPIFRHKTRKSVKPRRIKPAKAEKDDNQDRDIPPPSKEVTTAKRAGQEEVSKGAMNDADDSFPDAAPQGSLKVDELAKLLA